jgi:predicted amidohydrolase
MKLVLTQMIRRSEDINQNFEVLLQYAEQAKEVTVGADVVVLPELIGASSSVAHYESWVRTVARTLGCLVVGGSHHERRGTSVVNCGVVATPAGDIVARYDKHRPYGSELERGIVGGQTCGQFSLHGRHFVVLICLDLWFSDSFHQLGRLPDVVLIPSFSVSQKASPQSSQHLWQHMTVSRAYEFATYVGVSDWAAACAYDGLHSCGVAGLADPRPDGRCFFTPVGDAVFRSYRLNFARLDQLRENRRMRGFLWQPTAAA